MKNNKQLRDGEPCSHRGCLSHLSHPCEGCGRIGGITVKTLTDQRLASMENHFEVKFGMESKEYNFVFHLIRELHAERKVIEQMQSDYTELETENAMNRSLAIQIEKDSNFRIDCLEKELKSEKAKVAELQEIIDYIVDKESIITAYKNIKIIANPNHPVKYITKYCLVDIKPEFF